MLTLQRMFDEFGVEYTSEIIVVPKGDLDEATGLGNDLAGAVGAGFAEGGNRLKTWADYIADITGIAGEAFAQIEYDSDGKAVGFVGGSGEKAAKAYVNAFEQTLQNSTAIADAIGHSLSDTDKLNMVESQIESTMSVLSDLLDIAARDLRGGADGVFKLDDALGELSSGELNELYEKFNITDKSVQGLVDHIKELELTAVNFSMGAGLEKYNEALEDARINADIAGVTLGESFDFQDAKVSALQDRLEGLYRAQAKLNASSLLWTEEGQEQARLLIALIQLLEGELQDATNEFDNATSALAAFGSIGKNIADALFPKMVEGFENMGFSIESAQFAAAAFGTIIEGVINTTVSGLIELAAGFGELYGQWLAGADVAERWDNVLGNLALSIAETLSGLAVQAGLQLIVAGAIEHDRSLIFMGMALAGAGMAGKFVTASVKSYADEKNTQANASGGVYSGSERLSKYAKGGVLGDYVNSVVSKPTYFANGSALMGEAGSEAIMPLTRDSHGDLAVSAVGSGSGSAKVSININNYASDSTDASATQNSDGSIDVNIVKKMVASAIADGSTDNAMRSRYGQKVRGIN
jgi:hypothetical protein